jgi:hypothetical protein
MKKLNIQQGLKILDFRSSKLRNSIFSIQYSIFLSFPFEAKRNKSLEAFKALFVPLRSTKPHIRLRYSQIVLCAVLLSIGANSIPLGGMPSAVKFSIDHAKIQ